MNHEATATLRSDVRGPAVSKVEMKARERGVSKEVLKVSGRGADSSRMASKLKKPLIGKEHGDRAAERDRKPIPLKYIPGVSVPELKPRRKRLMPT